MVCVFEDENIGDEDGGEDEDGLMEMMKMMRMMEMMSMMKMMATSEQVTKEVDGQRKDNCGVFLRGN